MPAHMSSATCGSALTNGVESEHSLTCYPRIVPTQTFQLAPKTQPAKSIEQILNARQFQMLLPNHQIVALAHQRNEVEPEHACHGPGCQATIHRARLHLPSGREMPQRQLVITPNAPRFDSRALQPRIQQSPAARPFFSIYDGNILPGKILNSADVFRVASCGQDTLFPNGKRDHND